MDLIETKVIIYNGRHFVQDGHGYFYNSSLRKRLHQVIWETYNGPIPKGYDIHHIDFDRSNNDISNLQLMLRSDHKKLHSDNLTDEQREFKRNNMITTVQTAAVMWHKSDAGREWHSKHIKEQWQNDVFLSELVCTNCGKTFEGHNSGKNNFCSGACKAAYRRKIGADNIDVVCPVCGKTFGTNKFRPAECCSKHCCMILRHRRKGV